MKNILIIISMFLLFSCGNEKVIKNEKVEVKEDVIKEEVQEKVITWVVLEKEVGIIIDNKLKFFYNNYWKMQADKDSYLDVKNEMTLLKNWSVDFKWNNYINLEKLRNKTNDYQQELYSEYSKNWKTLPQKDFITNVKKELLKIWEIKNENEINFSQSWIILNWNQFDKLEEFQEYLFSTQEKYYYKYKNYIDWNLEIDFSKDWYIIINNKIYYWKYNNWWRGYNLGTSSFYIEKEDITNFDYKYFEFNASYIINYISWLWCKWLTFWNYDSFWYWDNKYTIMLCDNNKYTFWWVFPEWGWISTIDINDIKFNKEQITILEVWKILEDEWFIWLIINQYFSLILSWVKNNSQELLEIAYNLKYQPYQTLEQFIETYKGIENLKIEKIEDLWENKYKTLVVIDWTAYESIFEIVEEYKIKTISVKKIK